MSLEHTYEVGEVDRAAVRDALSGLTDDDVTVSSPVTAGGLELAVEVGEGVLVVREEGHDGEWSKTSESAVRKAVESVDGVVGLVEKAGGYQDSDE